MARLKNTDYLMYFDANKYESEMKKVLREATLKVRDLLYQAVINNIERLPFKANKVQMAGGGVTSDLERKQALLNSIDKGGHVRVYIENFSSYYGKVVMNVSLSAMEKNFEDSHIGWYYEIGTGEKSDPSGYSLYGMDASLGDVNPYRLPYVGAAIVSRSAKNGYWRDLGGNLRSTKSQIGGIGNETPPVAGNGKPIPQDKYNKMVERFRNYIGEDISAYYWFEHAVTEVSDQVLDIYKNAVLSIDIFDPKLGIFHINNKIEISDKYRVRS